MCWNKEVSLITFIFSLTGCLYLYKRNAPNDRWIAIFAIVISMIQLGEYFMWSDQKCGKMNELASRFIILILFLEPIVSALGGIYFSNISSQKKKYLRYIILLYIIFIIYVYFSVYNKRPKIWCGKSLCKNNTYCKPKFCNLQWLFLENIGSTSIAIWIIFLVLPFFFMKPRFHAGMIIFIGVATLFISHIVSVSGFASMWCWLTIFLVYSKIIVS